MRGRTRTLLRAIGGLGAAALLGGCVVHGGVHSGHHYPQATYHAAPVQVPPGHLPPPGHCRVWYADRPPGHQPPPVPC